MSGQAAGIYLVLAGHAWVRGGSLPNDPDKLRLMTRLTKMQWASLRGEVMANWAVGEDGRLHQKRLDAEWALAERRQKKASAAHIAAHKQAEAEISPKTENSEKLFTFRSRETAKKPSNFYARAPGQPYPYP